MGAENAECHCAKIGTSRYFFRLRLVSAHGCHFLICGFAKKSSARTWWLAGKVLNSPDFGAAGSHAGAWSSFSVAPRRSLSEFENLASRQLDKHGCHLRKGAILCEGVPVGSLPQQVRTKPSPWRQFGARRAVTAAIAHKVAPRASIRRPKGRFGSKCVQKGLSGVFFSPEGTFLQRQGTGGIAEKESCPSRPAPFANTATVHQAPVGEEHGGARQRKDGPRDFQPHWRSHERGREVHP